MDPSNVKGSSDLSFQEFERAKISVWWDAENCPIPKNGHGLSLATNIISAIERLNYSGDVSIFAYGDINLMKVDLQRELDNSGIRLIHIPGGTDDACNKKMIADMLLWANENPVPANIMLISGDGDFRRTLDYLGWKGYHLLLAEPKFAAHVLRCRVNIVWEWATLVDGGSPYMVKPFTPRTRDEEASMDVDDATLLVPAREKY